MKGEGILNLGRAFSYAGCKSLLMSHWEVSDHVTPALMHKFYQNIKEGQTKSMALRNAKLSYLASSDNLWANPYYWAPLVQLGDNTPLYEKRNTWTTTVGGVILLVMVVFLALKNRDIHSFI